MGRTILFITIFLSCFLLVNSKTFDTSIYGGKSGGGDISQALLNAWKDACASAEASKVLIPAGTFKLKEVYLKGPCTAPIDLIVRGTVKALPDPRSVTKDHEWIMIFGVDNLTISGNGVFDGAGTTSWGLNKERCWNSSQCNQFPNNFGLYSLRHATISDITSREAKKFHFNLIDSFNVTFQRLTIIAPENSPNTDGIHLGRTNQTTIMDTTFRTGDDCVSIGDGSREVNITRITCGPGHGISIGSLGKYTSEQPVVGVYVTNSNISNTINGVRIKTWAFSQPGEASDIHFENIRMDNVGNPILIDQLYCPTGRCRMVPSKVKLSNISFKGITGSSSTPVAVTLTCSAAFPCQEVEIGEINLEYKGGAAQSSCENVMPQFSGTQNPKITCK